MARVTKQVLIEALTKQGIVLTGKETVEQLKKLVEDNSITIEEAEAEEVKGFRVLDGNGKLFRVVEDEAEAKQLAAHIQGRVE